MHTTQFHTKPTYIFISQSLRRFHTKIMFQIWFWTVFAILASVKSDTVLEKYSDCACYLPNGTFVNLESLAASGGEPKFKDFKDQTGTTPWLFSYNPCYPFTQSTEGDVQGNLCNDVAVCQHNDLSAGTQLYYYNIGKQDTVKFELKSSNSIRALLSSVTSYDDDVTRRLMDDSDEHVTLTFSDDPTDPVRTSTVVLTCNEKTSEFIAVGEIPQTSPIQYIFQLADPAACPVAPPSGGISVGTVLCIILLIAIVVYLIVGFLIEKYVRHSGEIVPHKTFWVAVPAYVKDGCVFTYRTVTRKPDNYQTLP